MFARLIQAIAAEVPALDAARMYGLHFGVNGRARCPWHDDHRPDLSFRNGRCRCFACGAGGDSVALTAQIFGLSMSAAAAKLAADFKCTGTVAPAPRPRADAGRETWRTLCDVVHQADAELATFAPFAAWDNPRFRTVLRARCRANEQLDILWSGGRP